MFKSCMFVFKKDRDGRNKKNVMPLNSIGIIILESREVKTKNGILTINYWVGNNKNVISFKRLSCIGFLGFKIEG